MTRPLPEVDPQSALAFFSSGRYADYLVEKGVPVPAWAWVNAVARGSVLFVASLAMVGGEPRSSGIKKTSSGRGTGLARPWPWW